MKQIFLFIISITLSFPMYSQSFNRSELSTTITTPWEIIYGSDNFIWITESGGKVSRIDPSNGNKTVIYTAPDYFGGSPLEDSPLCPNLKIGSGTLGLALHPDFSNPTTAYIYFVYSYNSGTSPSPDTKFRIKRLEWNSSTNTVVSDTNIVNLITTGYDHLGGRLMAIKQYNLPYLFLTIGDNGRSEDSSPTCYSPQSTNPNNFTQDVTTQNGKIHRFNMDGTVPSDNPIAGNSFYTRGHRNPQGLMYNPNLDIIYDIEHGDNTDDEINILHKGMNYGWKDVRGYHGDNSFPGEANFVTNYVPNPLITNDSLVEPLFAWCNTPDTSSVWSNWCTVAPSGGAYYGSNGIPEWTNSLLVVTLKDGASTDKEVYQFKLQANGELAPSTGTTPNPKKFFGSDQALNGRLRDIAISNDGQSIYLINNGGATDKITVYQYDTTTSINNYNSQLKNVELFPNPTTGKVNIDLKEKKSNINLHITNAIGQVIFSKSYTSTNFINLDLDSPKGVYFLQLETDGGLITRKIIKE
jgi:PQQ-dependent dehydrogenase (s-GDH family)